MSVRVADCAILQTQNLNQRGSEIVKLNLAIVILTLAQASILLLSACGKNKEASAASAAQPTTTAAPVATPIDESTVGSISGVVKFDGSAPKPIKIDMSQDPACKGTNAAETLVVNNGSLENAFVYVKDGLGSRAFDTPRQEVAIDQQGCRFQPHVLGVMAGQEIKITNSDPTAHNFHATPKNNHEVNESQAASAGPLDKSFAHEEIMIPVKCNQHPWMKMYVNVVKSPFFAVADHDGKYELKGLPPGNYTVAVVQEKLGEQTQKVTVAPKATTKADFIFKAVGARGMQ
jgi:plastocyanin